MNIEHNNIQVQNRQVYVCGSTDVSILIKNLYYY